MSDPKMIRDEPDRIKQMLKDRAVKFDFEKMLELNKIRKEMMICLLYTSPSPRD